MIRNELIKKVELLSEENLQELLRFATFLKDKDTEAANLLSFFYHIERYALHDLKKLLSTADYDSPYGRFAVSIAQLNFSLLDIFGFLISDDNRLEDTEKNVKQGLQTFFDNHLDQLKIDVLVKIYRNGVVHSFFPKICSIRNTSDDDRILIQNESVWDLNVHPLSKLLLEGIENYIEVARGNSITLFHLTKRYAIIIESQEKAFVRYSGGLSKNKANTNKVETTTRPVTRPI